MERGFRSLKDPLGMRPIWHHTDRRVKAHIFVATLSFLIERMLERGLKDAGVPLSAQSALASLETIRYVQFRVDGQPRRHSLDQRDERRSVRFPGGSIVKRRHKQTLLYRRTASAARPPTPGIR